MIRASRGFQVAEWPLASSAALVAAQLDAQREQQSIERDGVQRAILRDVKHHVAGAHIEAGHEHAWLLLHQLARLARHHGVGQAIGDGLHQVLRTRASTQR